MKIRDLLEKFGPDKEILIDELTIDRWCGCCSPDMEYNDVELTDDNMCIHNGKLIIRGHVWKYKGEDQGWGR